MISSKKEPLVQRLVYYLLFFILLVYSLVETRNFVYPILLALLFAYLLYPLASYLEKSGVPRILANLISIILAGMILGLSIYFLLQQLEVFVDDFPILKVQALENVDEIEETIERNFGISTSEQRNWVKDRIGELFAFGSAFFQDAFTATTGTIAKIGLLPVYVFFLLYYRNKFKNFLMMVIPSNKHEKTVNILNQVSHVTERYMGGVVLVVLILSVLNSIGLAIVGLNYAIMLGIISALFNFIPYFGTLIGGIFPLLYALLLSSNPQMAVGVIIYFIIIQFVENNILTPNITGGNVQLNPFITILSIIIGGMVWGLPGMFLIVPFMAILKIVFEHVDKLHPYAYLMGISGTEDHSLTWDKVKKLWPAKNNKI